MITPEYCVTMARYNAWQNNQIKAAFQKLDDAALKKDRKAFFGSLLKTANHLVWGDMLWMSRFDGGVKPDPAVAPGGLEMFDTREDWEIARFQTDARILQWAEGVKAVDLSGALTWYSGLSQKELSEPKGLCVMHMFNHQTHHRGQIHAMLTAAGLDAPVSDIPWMPQDAGHA